MHAIEDLETTIIHQVGQVFQLQSEAQVGIIFAKAFHRFLIGQARPGAGQQAFMRQELGDQAGEQALRQTHDILPLDKGHFQVQLGELGLAVAALILIAETAGDLEIALYPGDHQHLLQLLRGLGQGVKLTRMDTRRNQIIAGAFGCGFEQDWRLDLDETLVAQVIADELDQLVAQLQVPSHALAAQVQIAIPQAGILVRLFFLVDRKWRGARRIENPRTLHLHLDFSGRQVGILSAGKARAHHTFNLDHPLQAHRLKDLQGLSWCVCISHHLDQSKAVP